MARKSTNSAKTSIDSRAISERIEEARAKLALLEDLSVAQTGDVVLSADAWFGLFKVFSECRELLDFEINHGATATMGATDEGRVN